MSKVSGFAILLAFVLAGMAVSCKSMTPTTATGPSTLTTTAPATMSMADATSAPTTMAAATSPWDGASIFFIPFAFIVLVFGIAMFSSRSKPDEVRTLVTPVGTAVAGRMNGDDELRAIAELWPRIPAPMRSAIMSVIRAAAK